MIRSLILSVMCLAVGLTACGEAPAPEVSAPAEPETEITAPVPDAPPEPEPAPAAKVVVIDPGHQNRANTDPEPIGPGAAETKMKVTGGTAGVATGIPEYELVLTVSQLLREELTARGYQVVLTRETHDVDLSNRQRADIAAQAGGDIFLRIHANGSTDQSAQGAMTLCPTPASPYPIGGLYQECRLLSDLILEHFVTATGAKQLYVWETDTMSGINWCQIPVTILEMGFMSSPAEDALLNDPAYQAAMVQGIANGVDAYFAVS